MLEEIPNDNDSNKKLELLLVICVSQNFDKFMLTNFIKDFY